MNNERKKLLVEALRSGEYKQGKGQLKKKDKFCCLGVACDIFLQHTGQGAWLENDKFKIKDDFNDLVLPKKVERWFGFIEASPMVIVNNKKVMLSDLNDKGSRFKTIAKLIEEQL